MSPNHHPDSATLEAYAAGALPSGARTVVGVHLRACAGCRRTVTTLETVGGVLLAQDSPAALPPDALQRTMAAIDTKADEPARLTLEAAMAASPWLRFPGGLAVKRLSLLASDGEHVALIRAGPGVRLPHHGHRGAERLVVLEGAFDDAAGHYAAGDLSERGPEDRHQPIACPGATCVCLSATAGPLKLSGLARWLQPLLGI